MNVGRYVRINTTDAAGGANGPWNLGIADVQAIESIYVTPASGNVYLDDDTGVDLKSDFTLKRLFKILQLNFNLQHDLKLIKYMQSYYVPR